MSLPRIAVLACFAGALAQNSTDRLSQQSRSVWQSATNAIDQPHLNVLDSGASQNNSTPFQKTSSLLAIQTSTAIASPSVDIAALALPPTGTGAKYASACDAQWWSWSSSRMNYNPTSGRTTMSTQLVNYTHTGTISTYDCKTTCGTICYAGTHTILGYTYTPYSSTVTFLTTIYPSFAKPTPTCSVGLSDCQDLFTTFQTLDSAYYFSKTRIGITPRPEASASPRQPACNTCAADPCKIDPQSVDLYYFPTTANVSRDLCASLPAGGPTALFTGFPNSTISTVTTGPYTVLDGRTLYSGNIYMSLSTISARDGCGSLLGPVQNGVMLTLAPIQVQSMVDMPKNGIPHSFNFADFNPPVPYSAYFAAPACQLRMPFCSVVFDDDYRPQIVMPVAVRQLDPRWATCSLAQFGLDDPPIALKPLDGWDSAPIITAQTEAPVSAVPHTTPPGQRAGSGPITLDPAPKTIGLPGPTAVPITFPAGSQLVTLNPGPTAGGFVVTPSETLNPGDPAATVGVFTVSAASNGAIISGPDGIRSIPVDPNARGLVVVTAGGDSLTVRPSGSAIVFGQAMTLSNGNAIVIGGAQMILGPSGVVVIDPAGTRTVPFTSSQTPVQRMLTTVITAGSLTLTATKSSGQLIVGTKTLDPSHPVATLSGGQIMSLAPSGVIVGGHTITIAFPSSTTDGTGRSSGTKSAGGMRAHTSDGALIRQNYNRMVASVVFALTAALLVL